MSKKDIMLLIGSKVKVPTSICQLSNKLNYHVITQITNKKYMYIPSRILVSVSGSVCPFKNASGNYAYVCKFNSGLYSRILATFIVAPDFFIAFMRVLMENKGHRFTGQYFYWCHNLDFCQLYWGFLFYCLFNFSDFPLDRNKLHLEERCITFFKKLLKSP